MNKMKLIVFVLVLSFFQLVTGQDKGIYQGELKESIQAVGTGNLQLNLPMISTLTKKVKDGYLYLKLDLGDDYIYGAEAGNTPFKYEVEFDLVGLNNGTTSFTEKGVITIKNSAPEGIYVYKVNSLLGNSLSGLTITSIRVENIVVIDNYTGGSANATKQAHQLSLGYHLDYGIDVSGLGAGIMVNPPTISNKMVTISWQSDYQYPSYQVQLLRLYNNDPSKTTLEESITATLDWSKAISIVTESAETILQMNVPEGTGNYVYRIRPIGSFYKNDIGDSRNWGEWDDNTVQDGLTVTLPTTTNKHFFYYDEPDDEYNYIYSRVYTEGNKQAENVIYANGLNQVRQTQAYLPDQNRTITSQSLQDHLGRNALATLPVPEVQKLEGFKEGFVAGFDLNDFDSGTEIENPSSLNIGYYDGTNNIADAQGFPYTRTIFYNDGTGRVKEVSGVGNDHKIGSDHTTRMLYGTASESELVALFGKEAPNHEAVQKVITIDPNNTASISYVDKSGKTIATALTFLEEDNAIGDNRTFEPLAGTEPSALAVKDKVTKNIKVKGGFVSAKKIVILEETSFKPSYKIKCETIENLCTDVELDCKFKVRLIIHSLDGAQADIILEKELNKDDCIEVAPGVKYNSVSLNDWNVVSGFTGSIQDLTLKAGTYMVEKKLVPAQDPDVVVTDAEERINLQVDPVANWITGRLDEVNCEKQLLLFYHDLVSLGNAFTNKTLTQNNTFDCADCSGESLNFSQDFWDIYSDSKYTDMFELQVRDNSKRILSDLPIIDNNEPAVVNYNTPCCNITLDVRYAPSLKCPGVVYVDQARNEEGDPLKLEVNNDFLRSPEKTEYFPDFEGYAIAMLKECKKPDETDAESEQRASEWFYEFMVGWRPGEFNLMIQHMLLDEYSCEGTSENTDEITLGNNNSDNTLVQVQFDECGAPIPAQDAQVLSNTQYQCSDLVECWAGTVMTFRLAYCDGLDLSAFGKGGNVSHGVDDNNDGDKGPHDDHLDDNFEGTGLLLKWIAKKAISKRMRDLNTGNAGATPPDNTYEVHLAQEFLNCAGYKFADIIEPQHHIVGKLLTDVGPLPKGTLIIEENPHYPRPSKEKTVDAESTSGATVHNLIPLEYDFVEGNLNYDVEDGEYTSELYTDRVDFGAQVVNPEKGVYIRDIFPNIKNPVYAFKYFEYQEGSFIDLEASICYKDPNDCYILDADGKYLRDDDGYLVYGPCCVTNLSNSNHETQLNWQTDECYKDYDHNYPDQQDGAGEFKYLVDKFCGTGRVKCEYNKEHWSCAQRYSFWRSIKGYTPPPPGWSDIFSMDCQRAQSVVSWYDNPDYGSDLDEACASGLENIPVEWFVSDCGTRTPPSGDPVKFTNLLGSEVEDISFIEQLAVKRVDACNSKCSARRSEFRAAVVKMFLDRCYEISDCKPDPNDNIVLNEDIDKIVDQMIAQCKSQCVLTTYKCEDSECRRYDTPKCEYGMNYAESKVILGAGGHVDGNGSAIDNDCIVNPNQSLKDCGTHNEDDLSYSEYTKIKQAMGWVPELDIVTKCNSSGEYVAGDVATHYYVNGRLTPHNQATCDDNPTNDTFVEKTEYELETTGFNTKKVGDKVVSPKLKLSVEVIEN